MVSTVTSRNDIQLACDEQIHSLAVDISSHANMLCVLSSHAQHSA